MSSKTKTTATKEEATPVLVPKLRFPEFRAAEEWSEMTVGGISNTVIAGGTPSTSEKKFWGGDIRWMNSGELNDKRVSEVQGRITREGLNNSSTKIIPPRCVLIGLAGQGKTRGTVAMNLVELCTNQSIAAIFPNDPVFDSDFLYHDLDRRYDELRRLSAGGEGRGGLNLQIIKSLPILLPSPAEQQKIAECLSSVDERIAAQARKLDALKTHKKGLMQQLFPREGETQPRLRFPEFQNAGAWVVRTMGSFASFSSGGTPSKDNPAYWNGSIPWISASSMYDLIIEKADHYVTPLAIGNGTRIAKKGSILILVRGSMLFKRVPICVAGIDVAFNQDVKALDVETSINTSFLLYQLSAFQCRIPINETGIGAGKIELEHLKEFELFFPEAPEQQRIADCLTSLDDLIAAQTQKHEALKTHKKGLMQQLFPSPEAT